MKTLTPAAVNRALDNINARKNPVLSEEDAAFVREARARIKELDLLVLAAIDKRQWTTADKLDSQRSKLWKAIDIREGRKPRSANPARKTRAVRVVAANPSSSRNLAAPRKKPRENWPRFVVEEQEGVGPWMPRAAFRVVEDAEKLAREIHKAQPSIAVRVIDTKS